MTRPLYNGPGKDKYFLDLGYQPKGVVHVGINDGEELPWYFLAGYSPIIGFEPNTKVYEEACKDFGPEIQSGRVILINLALGNPTNDEIIEGRKLNIPRRKIDKVEATKGGSLLVELYLTEEYEIGRKVFVPILPFDMWADNNHYKAGMCDLLVIDVQGMELEVLKGFNKYLSSFKYLIVECSEEPIYRGEARALDIVRYLKFRGFHQQTPILAHNDILFLRKNA